MYNVHVFNYSAKVTKVIDGDTVDCLVDLGFGIFKNERFRIKELNTKEIRKIKGYTEKDVEDGKMAKMDAEYLLYGDDVTVKTHQDKKGKYGRYLADVILSDGRSFSDIMKKIGHHYPR